MYNTLEELTRERINHVEGLKGLTNSNDSKDFSGFKNLLTNMYPDEAHFIYELLQNAEDKGAENVYFKLYSDRLVFEHDGGLNNPKYLFSLNDIASITGLAISTKKDDSTSIGKFGVGFKAVFSYTDTPRIYSGDFAFEIKEMFIPYEIDKDTSLKKGITRFVFPFNNSDKTVEDSYSEIETGLKNIKDNTLLFLKNINCIEYELDNGFSDRYLRIDEKDYITLVGKNKETNWLRFEKTVSVYDETIKDNVDCNIAVAFSYDKVNKQIVPCDGGVSIYFPAEKEYSSFKFIINAPFAPTIGRDSVRLCYSNRLLIEEIAILFKECLNQIYKNNLMNLKFFKVLPNREEDVPEFYKPIFNSIIDEFLNNPYFPTKDNGFTYLKNIRKGRARILDLISSFDLKLLLEDKDIEWLKNGLENSDEMKFIDNFAIKRVNFLDILNFKDCELFEKFIKDKDNKWLIKFYESLYDEKEEKSEEDSYYSLEYYKILKTTSNEFVSSYVKNKGYNAYYLTNLKQDVLNKNLIIIEPLLYLKEEDKNIKVIKFLKDLSVKEYNEESEIKSVIDMLSTAGSKSDYFVNLRILLDYYREHGYSQYWSPLYSLSSSSFIIDENDTLRTPSNVYLDLPYEKTLYTILRRCFTDNEYARLSEDYKEELNEEELELFIDLIKHYGVNYTLKLLTYSKDIQIQNFVYYLHKQDFELSLYIWNFFAKQPTYEATYRQNKQDYYNSITSAMRNSEWVPTKNSEFKKPSEILKSDLPEQFLQSNSSFLNAIGFGNGDLKNEQTEKFAKDLGCENVADAQRKVQDSTEIDELGIRDEVEALKRKKREQLFGDVDSDVKNPERRKQHNIEEIQNASQKKYEEVTRSVRTSKNNGNYKNFLLSQYSNTLDDELKCQLCQEPMPFRKKDKKWYFEAVEMFTLDYLKVEDDSFYLCLCPTCSAKYREYVKNNDRLQRSLIDEIITYPNKKSFEIITDKKEELWFKQKHIFDIRTKLEELNKNDNR